MQQSPAPFRTLFHGPFGAGQSALARDEVCKAADAGARDILYVVANGTARSAVISELVARRNAVFGLRVVTITGLPRELERRARVKGAAIAAGVVDDVLVEQAIRTAARNVGSPTVATGLAAIAAGTIAEIERGGGTPSIFADALQRVAPSGDGPRILLDTWMELERLRGSRARSAASARRAGVELLRARGDTLLGACSLVVLEDIPVSGPLDRDLIAALLAAAQCPVVATCEYASQLPSAPATRRHELLRSLAEWDERTCERNADPLSGAGTRVFAPPSGHDKSSATRLEIARLEAAGATGEVRLAARVITRHLRNAPPDQSIHASDILIVARGRHYRDLICEIFAESGIGVEISASRSVAETALGSVLLELLQLASDAAGGTREQAMMLVRKPHLDMSAHSADRLERRVVTRGYLGLDGWDERALYGLGKRATNRVNRLKRALTTARQSLAEASTNQNMARTVRRLAKELRLVGNAYFARQRIAKGEAGNVLGKRLAESAVWQDNEAWEVIEQVLDDVMPELLRAAALSGDHSSVPFAERWLALFTRALSAESRVQKRTGVDLVRVTGTLSGDGQPAKVTIILGLRQHVFPRQARQNPFLRDSTREQLRQWGIQMTTSEDTADRERESFVRVISTATENLYLSYPATDADGKPAVASFFIDDMQRAVGADHRFHVERLGVADAVPKVEDAISRAELLAAVAHGVWQRLPADADAEMDRAASVMVWNDLLKTPMLVAPVSGGRMAHLRPSFNQGVLRQAPHSTLELSASQLKTIQHCTFQHFVEKILQPESLDAPEYDALTKGSLVHEAMMRWVKLDGWRRGAAALGDLDSWFTKRIGALPPAARDGALARFKIDEDRSRLAEFVRGELDMVSRPDTAQPTYNELAFGGRVAKRGNRDAASVSTTFDLEVETSLGARTVKFSGSIDRVDVYHTDGATYGIALDYKTGATSEHYARAMADGSDLQVRLYLLALERLWNIRPVGALYVGFGDGIRRGAISEVAANRIGEFDPKFVTVMAPDEWDHFVHSDTERLIQPLIERLVTFDIIARPDRGDCGFCEFGSICRYDRFDAAFLNG